MVNIKKIQDKIDELKLSKAQLIKNSGLTRVTIDKILKGGRLTFPHLKHLQKDWAYEWVFFFDDFEVVKESATSTSGGASATGHSSASVGQNQAEHDELIRLREENKYLKSILAERDATIAENRRIINHFIGKA